VKKTALAFWLAVLITAAAGYGAWRVMDRLRSQASPIDHFARRSPTAASLVAGRTPRFSLTERSGETFDTRALDGKVWVVTFFYTSCPGPCFRQNQALAQVQKELAGRDIRFVSITCDPATDTPEKLREYAERFGADPKQWLFLTGKLGTIKDIAREQFLLPLDQQSHSERAIVIDHAGKIRDVFDTLDADDVKRMTKLLIELDDSKGAEQS
jgi:protein SCO1/2